MFQALTRLAVRNPLVLSNRIGGQTYGCAPHYYIFVSNWQIWSLVSFRWFFVFNISWEPSAVAQKHIGRQGIQLYGSSIISECVCVQGGCVSSKLKHQRRYCQTRRPLLALLFLSLWCLFRFLDCTEEIEGRRRRSSQTSCIAKHVKFSMYSPCTAHILSSLLDTHKKIKASKMSKSLPISSFLFFCIPIQTY
jgi:hypothetical protein